MTNDKLSNEYFNWMYQLVCDDKRFRKVSYHKLFRHLHDREFTYLIGMDGNRAADGVDLRYRFAYEHKYDYPMIARYLDNRPCSVLEMMIALAIRCEEHIMEDPDIGNRVSEWFWNMVGSLGLRSMSDSRYTRRHVDEILDTFLNREYEYDGRGGLFTIENTDRDLRSAEIWYQMQWYLNEIL